MNGKLPTISSLSIRPEPRSDGLPERFFSSLLEREKMAREDEP